MLKLAVDPMESPELYDFLLLMSGVVRADEGVNDALRGIMEGDRDSARTSSDIGGGGGGTLASMFKL